MTITASCFTQVLSWIDRHGFQHAVNHYHAEMDAKGFSCREQLVAMLFCQLGSTDSLREICGGLATTLGNKTAFVQMVPCLRVFGDHGSCQRKNQVGAPILWRTWEANFVV